MYAGSGASQHSDNTKAVSQYDVVEVARHGVSVTVGVPGLMRTGSPRNALFTGDRTGERAWFAVADSLPVLSMPAERAAERLVAATLRRSPELILTPAAKLGARLHGLAPATTLRLLTLGARFLPSDGTARAPRSGHALPGGGRLLRAATTLTRRAARRTHQHADPTPDPVSGPGDTSPARTAT